MATTMTIKGQVTIPKRVRDALQLTPGCQVEFDVNDGGRVVLYKAGARSGTKPDRFERARGAAQVKWRTKDLMALLRDDK
ncbi:MAG: type II toxin-antitoxin system PrlF family antitoxin [Gammaproteobacteria bacterium]